MIGAREGTRGGSRGASVAPAAVPCMSRSVINHDASFLLFPSLAPIGQNRSLSTAALERRNDESRPSSIAFCALHPRAKIHGEEVEVATVARRQSLKIQPAGMMAAAGLAIGGQGHAPVGKLTDCSEFPDHRLLFG
jgi:hypothetical protein